MLIRWAPAYALIMGTSLLLSGVATVLLRPDAAVYGALAAIGGAGLLVMSWANWRETRRARP